jgi:hypothetical protein
MLCFDPSDQNGVFAEIFPLWAQIPHHDHQPMLFFVISALCRFYVWAYALEKHEN